MTARPRTAVTSIDVARLADVSQSAVSRAFTPGASVSAQTRARVLDAANRLGWRPNVHARSLITKRSRIIGVVLSHLGNLFYPVALEALAQRLQRDGWHVLLFVTDADDADDVVSEILGYHVDGIVLAATTLSSTLAQRCADADIPVVLFNRVMAAGRAGTVSSVRSDNVGGGRAAARFLADAGHARIACLAGDERASTNLEREAGLREGLAERGLRVWARAIGGFDHALAREATLELFRGAGPRPDAVFAASDLMAFAAIDALRGELGLRVPEDVSVVGFDDVPQAAWPAYRLTTVRQPVAPMVEATAALLRAQLDAQGARRPEDVVVPGELVVRASARRPGDAR